MVPSATGAGTLSLNYILSIDTGGGFVAGPTMNILDTSHFIHLVADANYTVEAWSTQNGVDTAPHTTVAYTITGTDVTRDTDFAAVNQRLNEITAEIDGEQAAWEQAGLEQERLEAG